MKLKDIDVEYLCFILASTAIVVVLSLITIKVCNGLDSKRDTVVVKTMYDSSYMEQKVLQLEMILDDQENRLRTIEKKNQIY